MKKRPFLVCILSILSVIAFGQNQTLEHLIDKGVKYHDEGRYVDALTTFRDAYSMDSTSLPLNYELANTYIAMKKYRDAIYHADKVISANGELTEQAITLKGTALDLLGSYDSALITYRDGVKRFPGSYLLQYNTAITYFTAKQYKDAEGFAIDAINDNIKHASSHMILGYCKYFQGKRVEAMLAWYYFLLLEPGSKRANNVFTRLNELLNKGVSRASDTQISVSIPGIGSQGDFSAVELIVSMSAATRYTDENKNKSQEVLFADATETMFKAAGEIKENEHHKGDIWWDMYVPFFYKLAKSGNIEAFSYYVAASSNTEEVKSWLKSHQDDIKKLSKWYDDYSNRKAKR